MNEYKIVFKKNITDNDYKIIKECNNISFDDIVELAIEYYRLMMMGLINDYNTIQVIDNNNNRVVFAQSLELV